MIPADKDISITLVASDWAVVMQGVAELPYKQAAVVIARLEAQFRAAAPEAFVAPEAAQPVMNSFAPS